MNKHIALAILTFTLFTGTHAGKWSLIKKPAPPVEKLPLVYSDKYDISFYGLQKVLHSFDSCKYGKVHGHLIRDTNLTAAHFHQPQEATNEELSLVHTKQYLESLNSSSTIAQISEVWPLCCLPNFILQSKMLSPMRYATGGTILGAKIALEHGWAFNLSGGYHHAKADKGEGFCVYADIPLAIAKLWEENPELTVMVVDLDAHQGNGHEMILGDDKRVTIFDIYNGRIYPNDRTAEAKVTFNYPVEIGIKDQKYMQILKDKFIQALNELCSEEEPALTEVYNRFSGTINKVATEGKIRKAPDLIIYNAGTDIYESDPLGAMGISKEAIIERDEFVFAQAFERNIPILMVPSGGYTAESAEIISESIQNLFEKFKLID